MAKADMTKLIEKPALTPDSVLQEKKVTYRNIGFSADDEVEIDRIDAYLTDRGLSRTDLAKIVRIALKAAFRDVSDGELKTYYEEIKERHARGKRSLV